VVCVIAYASSVACTPSTATPSRQSPAPVPTLPGKPTQADAPAQNDPKPKPVSPLAADAHILDATVTDDGVLLLATERALVRWDPKGATVTKTASIAPAFASNAKPVGVPQESPDLHARFNDSGRAVVYSTATGANDAWSRIQVQAVIFDTEKMEATGKLTKVVKISQSPQYAVMASLSPNGALLMLAHPTAVAVFDVVSGKNLLHKEPSFADGTSFVDDNTVFIDDVAPGAVVSVTTGVSAGLPVKDLRVSPDHARMAAFDSVKNTLFVYDVETKKLRSFRSLPACKSCSAEWLDATHVRLLNRIARTQAVDVDVSTGTSESVSYAPHPVFTRGGFAAFEEYLDENTTNPVNVYFATPSKKVVKLTPLQKSYRGNKDYLLVGADHTWTLYDVHGETVWSHKR
jgi:hypothetical protein